jgi:hypothetical protein
LPLSKEHSGEENAEFAVEVIYFVSGAPWTDKGNLKIPLPALDLPISRTGLQLFYPPLFRLSAEPGSFHTETYTDPLSAALNFAFAEPPVDSAIAPPPAAPASVATPGAPGGVAQVGRNVYDAADRKGDAGKQAAQTLVDKFHASERGSRASGILPVRVNFPAFGPSLFLVSQLTSENQSPSAGFTYQEKKAGGK